MCKKIAIIFGVGGQDGHYLSKFLLEKDYKVVGVVRRSSLNNQERVEEFVSNANFTIIEGDITDAASVYNIVNLYQPDEIYNLAAQSHVGTSFKQPLYTFQVNALGPLNILEAVRHSPKVIKVYQASTSEMFGSNVDKKPAWKNEVEYLELVKTKQPLDIIYQDEKTPFHPRSPYAVAKVAAHQSVQNYRESYGVFGCCGILFNHESPMRGENFVTRKITKWLARFVKDKDIAPLQLGNLDAYRDWGHARDYVEAMWMMLQHDVADDYVVATGVTHSVRDFLDKAFKHIGVDDWTNYVEINPEFYRPAEVEYLRGSPDKINKILNWAPKTSFEQLVEEMVDADVQKLS